MRNDLSSCHIRLILGSSAGWANDSTTTISLISIHRQIPELPVKLRKQLKHEPMPTPTSDNQRRNLTTTPHHSTSTTNLCFPFPRHFILLSPVIRKTLLLLLIQHTISRGSKQLPKLASEQNRRPESIRYVYPSPRPIKRTQRGQNRTISRCAPHSKAFLFFRGFCLRAPQFNLFLRLVLVPFLCCWLRAATTY